MEERTEIESLGEFGLIQHLTQNNDTKQASTLLSVGVDAAVIDHFGKQTVITTDMLIEGIHFDLMYTPLKHLGYKAVAVNLSDLCAMMATPTHITMSIAFSNRFSVEALDEFYEGVYAACEKYNVDLVGGDTCSSQKGFIISVTAIGEVTNDKFVTRDKAQPNDLICATGDLGAAYIGLQLLEREKRIFIENPKVQPDLQQKAHVIGKFLKPEPRLDVVEWLRENNIVPTAMMDISDGLSSDLLHICRQSNVGCVLYDEKLPIDVQTKEMAMEFGMSGTSCALNGGEDYELLFTVPQSDYDKIVLSEKISVIGYITNPDEGTHLVTQQGNRHKLVAQGWRAF
ncbi:MAG TPA: thiamine-phosphate kinase [Chitinophagaceae bacterium]|nr:thiamine-phosphate kinase [Chitinophagaceae bacterium]